MNNEHAELLLKADVSQHRVKAEPLVLYIHSVYKTFILMVNRNLNRKQNGFWSYFLFFKKECPSNLQNDTRERTNTQEKIKNQESTVNYQNTSNEISRENKIQACPGKILPMKRRGCGFHFYMCIDNVRKSDITRNNKLKQIDESNYVLRTDNVDLKNKTVCERKTCKITREKHSLENSATPPKKLVNTQQAKVLTNTKLTERQKRSNEAIRTKGLPEGVKDVTDSESPESPQRSSVPKNITSMKDTPSISKIVQSNLSMRPSRGIRFSSMQKYINSLEQESVKSVASLNKFNSHKIKPMRQDGRAPDALDDEFKRFETYGVRRKSSLKSMKSGRSVFMNSPHDISPDRISYDGTMVKLILSKLNIIEGKILDLEKKGGASRKDVKNIVDVSCKGVKSTDQEGTANTHKSLDINPSKPNTVVIKVCGEDVIVNTPDRGTEVRKKRNERENIYTLNLDVHRTDSCCTLGPNKSKIRPPQGKISSQTAPINTNILTNSPHEHKYPHKLPPRTQISSQTAPTNTNMWRRISEELKV